MKADRDSMAIAALQYLLDEGFIKCGFIDGEPSVFITTDLKSVHKALGNICVDDDSANWWKK